MMETVKEGISGWLVNSEEELADRIKHVSGGFLRPDSVIRKVCREWVADNFTVQKMVDGYNELITEAVDTGGW